MGPIETTTISSARPFSLRRTASSTAISQKGFIDIFTLARSTPVWSVFTLALTLESIARLTGTRIFIVSVASARADPARQWPIASWARNASRSAGWSGGEPLYKRRRMNGWITNTKFVLLALFLVASLATVGYEWRYVWPARSCEARAAWWDAKDRQCLGPM